MAACRPRVAGEVLWPRGADGEAGLFDAGCVGHAEAGAVALLGAQAGIERDAGELRAVGCVEVDAAVLAVVGLLERVDADRVLGRRVRTDATSGLNRVRAAAAGRAQGGSLVRLVLWRRVVTLEDGVGAGAGGAGGDQQQEGAGGGDQEDSLVHRAPTNPGHESVPPFTHIRVVPVPTLHSTPPLDEPCERNPEGRARASGNRPDLRNLHPYGAGPGQYASVGDARTGGDEPP